jgi:hypothetical protein
VSTTPQPVLRSKTKVDTRDAKPKVRAPKTELSKSAKLLSRPGTLDKKSGGSIEGGRKRKSLTPKSGDRISSGSRATKAASAARKDVRSTETLKRSRDRTANKTTVVGNSDKSLRSDARGTGDKRHRRGGRSSKVRYEERQHVVKHVSRHEHVYRDRHHRIRHRIIWPRYHFPLYYSWGPSWTFRYVYPYYHRKYLFVSLGGYWPVGYRYVRYYWYPCHSYDWYGYYPVAREVQGDTYNYYTYNSYTDGGTSAGYSQSAEPLTYVDENTFADVREKLAGQAQEPEAQTMADVYFDEAVKAFESGDYDTAADKFAEAMGLAPDDMVLPFAYVQTLFANKRYLSAAEVLRETLVKVSPEEEGVFYPRGLYPEEDTLFEQIDLLADKMGLYGFDPDLQLLLGYQLLGIGELEEATGLLQQASLNSTNAASATILLDLLEKIKTETDENVEQ